MKSTLLKMALLSICLILGNILVIIKPISQKHDLEMLCLKYNIIDKIDKKNNRVIEEENKIINSIARIINIKIDLNKEKFDPC